MPLESLEGLPDEVANLYRKGEDGKFHLKEGDGLKSALEKERERANTAEKALKERERLEADAKAKQEREEMERKGEYEKLKASLEAEKTELAKKAQESETNFRTYLIKTEALKAIAAHKGSEALLGHIVESQLEVIDGKVLVKGDPAKNVAQFVEALKSKPEYAPAFAATANGAGTLPAGTPAGKSWGEMSLKERTETYKTNPTLAKQLMGDKQS